MASGKTNKTKVNPETGLTDKEELFCIYYLKYLKNGRAAYQALNPKCKDTSAMTRASLLLRKVEVNARITQLMEERRKNANLSLDDLVDAAKDLYAACRTPIKVTDIKGNPTGEVRPADAKGANDALKNLGKWLGYEETTSNITISGEQSFDDTLRTALDNRVIAGVDDNGSDTEK